MCSGASVAAVADVLLDPSFHRALALPDLSLPEVLEHSSEGAEHMLEVAV